MKLFTMFSSTCARHRRRRVAPSRASSGRADRGRGGVGVRIFLAPAAPGLGDREAGVRRGFSARGRRARLWLMRARRRPRRQSRVRSTPPSGATRARRQVAPGTNHRSSMRSWSPRRRARFKARRCQARAAAAGAELALSGRPMASSPASAHEAPHADDGIENVTLHAAHEVSHSKSGAVTGCIREAAGAIQSAARPPRARDAADRTSSTTGSRR